MSELILFIVEHPRDSFAVLSMAAIMYLVNAIKNRIEQDFHEMRKTQLEHGEMLTKIRIALAENGPLDEELMDVKHELRQVEHRVERLENAHGI